MAYEGTEVSIQKSQDQIRKLIMSRKGSKIAFISEPPRETFAAEVKLDGVPYQIRISARRTVAEMLLPKLSEVVERDPSRLLSRSLLNGNQDQDNPNT